MKLTKDLESSISAFDKVTKARSMRLAFKSDLSIEDFVILKTLGTSIITK
jgi:hypothetical protein